MGSSRDAHHPSARAIAIVIVVVVGIGKGVLVELWGCDGMRLLGLPRGAPAQYPAQRGGLTSHYLLRRANRPLFCSSFSS
jgi:hypothetical protein